MELEFITWCARPLFFHAPLINNISFGYFLLQYILQITAAISLDSKICIYFSTYCSFRWIMVYVSQDNDDDPKHTQRSGYHRKLLTAVKLHFRHSKWLKIGYSVTYSKGTYTLKKKNVIKLYLNTNLKFIHFNCRPQGNVVFSKACVWGWG